MDLHSGIPFFHIRNGLPFLYPSLAADHRCDVLVIGGGITGALCAHACTLAGARVAVIDRRAIATGSTAASTALLQYEIDTPLHELAESAGMEVAVASYRLCADAIQQLITLASSLGVDVRARNSLQYASRRGHVKGLRSEFELRTRHGFDMEFLEAAAVKARFGFSQPAPLLCRPAAQLNSVRIHTRAFPGYHQPRRTCIRAYRTGTIQPGRRCLYGPDPRGEERSVRRIW